VRTPAQKDNPAIVGARNKIHLRGEGGATLVEVAISLSLFLIIFFGVMEISLMLYTYHYISDAAREATRYAMVRGSTATTNCSSSSPGPSDCIAQGGNNTGDIATYVQNIGFPGISVSDMTVNSTWLSFSSSTSSWVSCGTSNSCKTPGNIVQVTISYNFPFSVPLVPAFAFGGCTPTTSVCMASTSEQVIAY
jgi:Flp pilus assembly protein TadG